MSTHFARRLSEILGARPKPRRWEVKRDLAKKATEHTRPARQKQQAIRSCRRVVA